MYREKDKQQMAVSLSALHTATLLLAAFLCS